jgi:hypothetical protein
VARPENAFAKAAHEVLPMSGVYWRYFVLISFLRGLSPRNFRGLLPGEILYPGFSPKLGDKILGRISELFFFTYFLLLLLHHQIKEFTTEK